MLHCFHVYNNAQSYINELSVCLFTTLSHISALHSSQYFRCYKYNGKYEWTRNLKTI